MENTLEEWAGDDQTRQAVHTILLAVASDEDLKEAMVMKGGMLMSIKYSSDRYTDDIDFSNRYRLTEENLETLYSGLDEALTVASSRSGYSVVCWCQSREVRPKVNGTFPTIQIKIGFADRSNKSEEKYIHNKRSSRVIKIDCSYNEVLSKNEVLSISDEDENILTYSIYDIVGEKFRALLQQLVRNHNKREQDVYDLHFILKNRAFDGKEKAAILKALAEKSVGRGIKHLIHQDVFSDDKLMARSKSGYANLADLVEELPDFDVAYSLVAEFYMSLPWEMLGNEIVLPDPDIANAG